MKRRSAMLAKLGITIHKEAHILDFGCGAGRTVYSLLDQGYSNVYGYDIKDYLNLSDPEDRTRFFIADAMGGCRLPFGDNTFDLVISEQVLEHVMDQIGFLRELHRVMRPNGYAIHGFPARYCPVEPHTCIPLGGFFAHHWWYKLWALLGIRNKYQQGLSADEVADQNSFYFAEALNYVPNSTYQALWHRLGYTYKWLDQENFDTSERAWVRIVGKLNRVLPLLGWLFRTFHTRRVLLTKQHEI